MLSSVLVVLLFLSTISEGASCSSNFTVPLNEDNPTSCEFNIVYCNSTDFTSNVLSQVHVHVIMR